MNPQPPNAKESSLYLGGALPHGIEGLGLWTLQDPFGDATHTGMELCLPGETGGKPQPESPSLQELDKEISTRIVLSLDGVLLRWNAEAKHRLRAAGWEVQGGMTYRTLDLVRDWTRAQIALHRPVAFLLRLPPQALLPDLSSPNACLLLGSVLPEIQASGLDLVVRRDASPEDWECARTATNAEASGARDVLAKGLGAGKLWVLDEKGIARDWNI